MAILAFQQTFPKLAGGVYVAPSADVIGDVELGADVSIWFHCTVRGDVNDIRIGRETNIQDNSVLHVTGGQFPLRIGQGVVVGHRVIAHGCTIGDHCLIGMGAIILDGAVIGEGSIVAAGAVVPEGMVVPAGMLVAGVPAKVKRPVTDVERARIAEGVRHYVELKNIYLHAAAPGRYATPGT
ncbi:MULTISPECIES: gamma carbonic anhydrase family protein [Chloracidobacterium]|jgi:carbonic anhydrase/acetyltransferase-like protein (isoleucine patch superfamily)|uniref:Carbonic anhydrases/acetyltransferase, isoleucine patch superfamily n=1 Tax=Chloracidobacterium thermophilum (strain B) TaxID=981222 RepID=G2LG51_CHLTF|nr:MULTISPECIES: gamma carbonic anhydrase family protein [Chloracidobacterium]AEP12564.1 Carbonic anhydrases/acetyltransferase, isoleucine patch superfamily [Chloracidobacterium thermophilum B]QUV78311.1 gamma carbonic anhydrase family protein [Chloracidobacterium thermophilum]QUV81350.1 gamma carbonic anhydrase family protein [Chloracidobacterium sp. D]